MHDQVQQSRDQSGSTDVTRSHLPLSIQGLTENAVVDTGAQENVISEALAKKLKLTVHKAEGEAHRFVNVVGKKMNATGYTHVPCAFQDNPQRQVTSRFWVFPKLIVPLLVGRKFLESTETLTRFRHRLQKLIVPFGISLRVLHMEVPRWRMNCTVDGRATLVNPDTGSDLDLMSLSFARENGFRMENLPPGREYIQFADGTEHRLEGVVSVPFAIGRGEDGSVNRKFYVLDGLISEVLLGNQTLEEVEAFNMSAHELVDLEEYDNYCDFHFIRWVQRSGHGDYLDAAFHEFEFSSIAAETASTSTQQSKVFSSGFNFLRWRKRRRQQDTVLTIADSEARSQRYLQFKDISEQRRRTHEAMRIARLCPHERTLAETAERDCQDRYDRDRAGFVAKHNAAVALIRSKSNFQDSSTSGIATRRSS